MLTSKCAAFRTFVNSLRLPWRKTQRENLIRWGGAFLQRRSLPVRRLARTLATHPKQAKVQDQRLRRFLGNDRLALAAALAAYREFLLPRLGPVPYVPLMLDWTYVGERAILSLKIPYRGRSLPLLETVHERSIERRVYSQTQAEIALLRRVRWCWPQDAPPPLVLADRGFDKSRLLEWLLHGTTGREPEERAPSAPGSHPWLFVIRSCMEATVTDEHGERLAVPTDLAVGAQRCFPNVRYHQTGRFALHLVVRCEWDAQERKPTTWYLITNLPEPHLGRVPRLYAHRMQPEETYRDSKRGYINDGFGLHRLARLRRDRLERLLFCLGLVYGFLVLLAESERNLRADLWRQHFRLSLISYAFDALEAAPALLRQMVKHACAYTQLEPLWLLSGDS
jgi:hypothetical protein